MALPSPSPASADRPAARSQAVVWQTTLNPAVALELLSGWQWKGSGINGPEALPAEPFLGLLAEYEAPWGMREQQM